MNISKFASLTGTAADQPNLDCFTAAWLFQMRYAMSAGNEASISGQNKTQSATRKRLTARIHVCARGRIVNHYRLMRYD